MRRLVRHRPSPAMIVALVALFVAMSGASYAALIAPSSVGPRQLKKDAVRSPKVKDHSLKAIDFAEGQLPAGPQGPKGPKGEQGPAGVVGSVVVRRVDFSLPAGPAAEKPGVLESAFVSCGPGEKIIGGSVNVSNPANAEVRISRPAKDNVGSGAVPEDGEGFSFWKGTARATTNEAGLARVFAICAK